MRANGWTRPTFKAAALMLMLSGCASTSGDAGKAEALCAALSEPSAGLAAAVVHDGGPASKAAARRLLAMLEAGCWG